jgi:hypothetical protein
VAAPVTLRWSAAAVVAAAVGGAMAATLLRHKSIGHPRPDSTNIFFHLYALHERPFFILLAAFALLVWVFARPATVVVAGSPPAPTSGTGHPRRVPLMVGALTIGVLSWVGSRIVLHNFPFSLDEFNAVFQAEILASGRLSAPVPAEWQPFAPAMTPVFVSYYPEAESWRSGYLPGYAAIRALFRVLGGESLTNPVLAALTLLVLAGVGRRLWPERPQPWLLAVLFLATSSQFLLTSMSWYSMPAHLLLNLVWLWLYLRNDTLSLAAAPLVGVLALGLHNPFPHALFAAPFLVRALRRHRFAWLSYAAVVYGAGALVWYAWLHSSTGYLAAAGGQGLLSAFMLPGARELASQALHLSLVLSWQPPVVVIFALVALWHHRRLSETERDVAGGLLLTAGFYLFVSFFAQGHGWGYRYIYSALGNLIMLSAAGAEMLRGSVGRVTINRLVGLSTAVALLVQLPLRALQAERFVRPFARATEYVATLEGSVAVVVHPDSSYYGRDLVRNDPFLRNTPKLFFAPVLGDSGIRALSSRFGGRVHQLRSTELARLGIKTF